MKENDFIKFGKKMDNVPKGAVAHVMRKAGKDKFDAIVLSPFKHRGTIMEVSGDFDPPTQSELEENHKKFLEERVKAFSKVDPVELKEGSLLAFNFPDHCCAIYEVKEIRIEDTKHLAKIAYRRDLVLDLRDPPKEPGEEAEVEVQWASLVLLNSEDALTKEQDEFQLDLQVENTKVAKDAEVILMDKMVKMS